METGVVVAESGQAAQTAVNENFELFVGDFLEFTAGLYTGTKGMIYYLDEDLLRILPEGASDRLIDIETTVFADETTQVRVAHTALNTFVEIADLKEGNAVQTFDANGLPIAAYKVTSVNLNEDSVVLKQIDSDGNEIGDQVDVIFTEDGRIRGIPREIEFAVMRAQEMPKPPRAEGEEDEAEEEEEEEGIVLEQVLDEPEEEAEEIIRERRPEEVIYDDIEQKNDFIEVERASLKPEKRTNVKELQRIRRLMENCIQLRNDILEYKETGRVETKPVAYETLANLLSGTEFPLAKPVLRVYKTLYLDHTVEQIEGKQEDPVSFDDDSIDIQYLTDAVDSGIEFIQENLKMKPTLVGEVQSQVPRLYTVFKQFYDQYFRVLGPMASQDDSRKGILYDRDFFRLNPIPESEPLLKGFSHTAGDEALLGVDDIKNISLSYLRALKPRYGRYGDRKTKIVGIIEEGDEADVWRYVMFPFLFLRDLGAIRSGKLSIDIGNSLKAPKTMEMILEESGGIQEIPEADKVLILNPEGTSIGNIELTDWLKTQTLYGNGIGDILPYLKSVGLGDAEFTPDQQEVLLRKIQYYQASLKKFLIETRKEANEIIRNPVPVKNFSLLSSEDQNKLMEILSSEKILLDKISECKIKYPSWQNNDVAIFSYLYTQYPDYVIATLSQVPTSVAEERLRVAADMFLKRLYESIEEQKKITEEGAPPIVNECDHVKNLSDIRKIQDDDQRIQVMVRKFLPMFAGKTMDHWIDCKICKGHLLCEHEYLMILEKTHPNQKDIIHKNILMAFSDGIFQGKFICGNCGQPIQELEFDQNMEFDDEGRPMMGNEAITEEMETSLAKELDKLLGVTGDNKYQPKKNDFSDNPLMKIVNEVAATIGIPLGQDAYERMNPILTRLVSNNLLSMDAYKKQATAKQEDAKRAGKILKMPDYDQYRSDREILYCISVLFIEIQTVIPDYPRRQIHIEGCGVMTFDGFPLVNDQNQISGVNYMACVLNSLVRGEKPWSQTSWFSMPTSKEGIKKRLAFLTNSLATVLNEIQFGADVQQLLEKKREYLVKEKGEEAIFGRALEIIPPEFMPRMISRDEMKNAEAPIIGDAATAQQRALGWLLEGYKRARTYGVYERGNPVSEASCCYSSLKTPESFWKEQNMPALNPKMPPQGPQGSILAVDMKVREAEELLGDPDAKLMYRLFLRVCFPREGIVNPNVGLQHAPGYDNKCPYCQFEFPVDPRLPPPQLSYSKDKKIQEEYTKEFQTEVQDIYQKEIQALQAAGVTSGPTVQKDTFETLLQATNSHFIIPPLTVKRVATGLETIDGLMSIDPEPFLGFRDILKLLKDELTRLPPDASETDVRLAYGKLSEKMNEFIEALKGEFKNMKLGGSADAANKIFTTIRTILEAPPQTQGELLRTFLLLPLRRSLTTYEYTSILMKKRKTIYSTISTDDRIRLETYLDLHKDQVAKIKDEIEKVPEKKELLHIKIRECIDKLVVVVPILNRVLRANVVPFGPIGLNYLKNAIVAGIFWEFINPEVVGGKSLRNILGWCLLKPRQPDENTILSPDEIRKVIAARNEGEKVEIIKEFDRMEPDEKRAELAMKALGLGRWARGASKGIFSYDEEQQAFEAAERMRRGVTDFYGLSAEEKAAREREEFDEGGGEGYDAYADDGEQ